MLDMQEDFQEDICDKLNRGPLDAFKLIEAIKSLSTADLSKLEDDLDFAQFTGIQSSGIQAMIAQLGAANLKLVA